MTRPGNWNGKNISFAEFRGRWIEQVLADKKLQDGTFRFLVGLAHHYLNSKERRIWASQSTMAERFGISLRSVNGHLSKLVRRKHLTVQQKGRDTPNDYFPNLYDAQNSAHQSSPSKSIETRFGNRKTRKSASDDTQVYVDEVYADLRTNTLNEHFEEHRGSPPDGGSPQCHSSTFTLDNLKSLSDHVIIPPDAARAARAEIVEFFAAKLSDVHSQQRGREMISRALDSGSFTKARGNQIVQRINFLHSRDIDEVAF